MLMGLVVKDEESVCFELGHDLLVEVLHLGRCLFSSFNEGAHECFRLLFICAVDL